jgi:hypothetical protein
MVHGMMMKQSMVWRVCRGHGSFHPCEDRLFFGSIYSRHKEKKMAVLHFKMTFHSLLLIFLTAMLPLSGCYNSGYRVVRQPVYETPTQRQVSPPTQVYFYPRGGQTAQQQGRDHYECFNWAVKQTNFDPGVANIPANDHVRLAPMPPPGHDTATMAIAGAVMGALIGGRRNAPAGALIGAAGGAIAGAVSDSARQEAVRRQEDVYNAQNRARSEEFAEKEHGFRRAMCACLEGRGYSVR